MDRVRSGGIVEILVSTPTKMIDNRKLTGTNLSLVLFGVALVTFSVSYGLNVVLARNLPTQTYGNLVFAFRVLGAVSALSLLGTGTSSTRFLAKYLTYQSTESVESFLRWNTRLIRWPLLASVTIGVVTCVSMFCANLLGWRDIGTYHLAVFMLWVAPLFSLVLLLAAYLLCADRPIVSAVSSRLLPIAAQLVLFASLLVALRVPSSKLLIIGAIAASAVAVIVLQLVYLHRGTALALTDLWPWRRRPPPAIQPEWLRVSLWLIMGQVLLQITQLLDVTLLEFAPGRDVELGYYGAALAITYLLFIVPRATLSPLAAKVSSLLETPETRLELQTELSRVVGVNTALIVGLGTPMVWFSRELLSSFGVGYESAQTTLVISVATAFVAGLGNSALTVISRSDMEKTLLALSGLDLVILLVVGTILVGPFGMNGVATALLCAAALRTTLAVLSVRRRHGLRPLGFV